MMHSVLSKKMGIPISLSVVPRLDGRVSNFVGPVMRFVLVSHNSSYCNIDDKMMILRTHCACG